MNNSNSNSSVETPPEWLLKLEQRREQVMRTKLGHEAGAGSPCTECSDCPGLDLHFWRKVCRLCKCRKDQHLCPDDDMSAGWAQFEILGQIRAKPAFIKIKALASQPVQLEWVPPNVPADVVSDYMEKLGTTKIPVMGSEAANKRKQQLEFQVPPHDLDAALCDNLTVAESEQMEQYVRRIRDSCVGQGCVVRIGNVGQARIYMSVPAAEGERLQPAVRAEDVVVGVAVGQYATPVKTQSNDLLFNSPLPLKDPIQARAREVCQDTPIRKIRWGSNSTVTQDCGFPTVPEGSYGGQQQSVAQKLEQGMAASRSTDSGFDSKPPTPSHATGDELNAAVGRFVTIPGIEDMNMYPAVKPGQRYGLGDALQHLQLNSAEDDSIQKALVIKIKCGDCALPISFGEVAVKAERAGKEVAWHPECFKCHICRELLADLVYFFHAGNVYCGRDLAIKLKIPRCKACDELIFTKEYTAAENATFHIKHFCCYQCDTPLAGQQYVPDEKSNMPLCLKCYDEFFAAACQACGRQIGPADQGVSHGAIHWHGSCFNCSGRGCDKSLIGGRFCIKEKLPFCSPACVRSIAN